MKINTCKWYIRVIMAMAEGHVVIPKGSAVNMEVSGWFRDLSRIYGNKIRKVSLSWLMRDAPGKENLVRVG